jgi:hypothetical protein
MTTEPAWYFDNAGQPEGPVAESELRRRIAEGELPPTVLVWTAGRADWTAAAEALPPPVPAETPVEAMPAPPPAALPPPVPVPDSISIAPATPAEPAAPAAVSIAAAPPKPARPTSLTVFGVLNIVFALLSMLCLPISILSASTGGGQTEALLGQGFRTWSLFSYTVQFIMSAMLLVLGIGLLRCAEWARKGTVIYGWFSIVYGLVGTIGMVIFLSNRLPDAAASEAPVLMIAMVSSVAGGLGGLVYPVLQIIFMQRPIARAACVH